MLITYCAQLNQSEFLNLNKEKALKKLKIDWLIVVLYRNAEFAFKEIFFFPTECPGNSLWVPCVTNVTKY